jgi:hypothetical protein
MKGFAPFLPVDTSTMNHRNDSPTSNCTATPELALCALLGLIILGVVLGHIHQNDPPTR